MKSHKLAIVAIIFCCLYAGSTLLGDGRGDLKAQEEARSENQPRDTSYAEAELELARAQLTYVTGANERLGGGVYPRSLVEQLRLKVELIETYIEELKKDQPDSWNILKKNAENEVKLAELELELETVEDRRKLREMAVALARKRLERVQDERFRDHENQQDWEIAQLQLTLADLRIRLELVR